MGDYFSKRRRTNKKRKWDARKGLRSPKKKEKRERERERERVIAVELAFALTSKIKIGAEKVESWQVI